VFVQFFLHMLVFICAFLTRYSYAVERHGTMCRLSFVCLSVRLSVTDVLWLNGRSQENTFYTNN